MTFADALHRDFPLSNDEKEVVELAHRWLAEYCARIKAPSARILAPRGTAYEAWTTLTLVYMLWGFPMHPAPQVNEAVPTPPDFIARIAALVQRLEIEGATADAGRALMA